MSGRDKKNSNYQHRRNYSRNRSKSYKGGRGRKPQRSYIKPGTDVYLLDILQHGGVDKARHSWDPIAQIIVMPQFYIYEVTLNKDKIQELKLEEKYEFNLGGENYFQRVNKLLNFDQITPASNNSLQSVIRTYVANHEERFIKFINNVGPITIKRHYLEVLPGVGKKLMNDILTERNRKPFESYKELHSRVPGFKPVEVLTKRIIEELEDENVKHRLFVRRPKPGDTRRRRTDPRHHYKSRRPDYH